MQNYDLLIQYIINKELIQKLKARNNIFYVQMNVTNHCMENCWHCYLRGRQHLLQEAPARDFVRILEQTKEWATAHSKTLSVDLIGGDPLLKSDLDKILSYLANEKINYGIKGNPQMLTDHINNLINRQCKRYQMSLDGLQKTHDSIRSVGSFQATLKAVRLLNEHNMPVTIKYTMSERNCGDLWRLLYSLYENDYQISNFLVARYHQQNGDGFQVSEQYYEDAFEKLKSFYMMQLQNGDIRIHVGLKEHLWIPYLAKKQYLLKDFYELLERTPYLSSCSMISSNTTMITPEGYFDVCPKITSFDKTSDISVYMKRKYIFTETLKHDACKGCRWRTICLGCPAFYTKECTIKDRDCFLYEQNNEV